VFEQSLLLNQDGKRPWNFLASLSAELLAVSLVLLIPLAYHDHLPAVHWKDITVEPAPLPPPVQPQVTHTSGPTSTAPSSAHRQFHWDPTSNPAAPETSAIDIAGDTPPALTPGVAGAANSLGYIPNVVAGPPPNPIATPQKEPASAPLQVGGDVQMAKLIRKIIPEYPSLARSARISGVVHLIGTIGKDGAIRDLQLVSGHPMLARAAMAAVQQWLYKPTLLNGKPVEVIAPIEVSFTLAPQ
jgi:protein TonB